MSRRIAKWDFSSVRCDRGDRPWKRHAATPFSTYPRVLSSLTGMSCAEERWYLIYCRYSDRYGVATVLSVRSLTAKPASRGSKRREPHWGTKADFPRATRPTRSLSFRSVFVQNWRATTATRGHESRRFERALNCLALEIRGFKPWNFIENSYRFWQKYSMFEET